MSRENKFFEPNPACEKAYASQSEQDLLLALTGDDILRHKPILGLTERESSIADLLPDLPKIEFFTNRLPYEISPSFEGIRSFNEAEIEQLRQKLFGKEGVRSEVYKDTKGIATIGVGFNLESPPAKEAIEYLGADFEDVRSGKASLSNNQIQTLTNISLANAIRQAEMIYPNMGELPYQKKAVLVDLTYNLGGENLRDDWPEFSEAVRNNKFATAAGELQGTRYARQVGQRAKDNIKDLKN